MIPKTSQPDLTPAQCRLLNQANDVRKERSDRYSGLLRGAEINAGTLTALLRAAGLMPTNDVIPPRVQMLWQVSHKLNRAAGPNPDEDDFRDAYNYLQGAYELYLQEFHSNTVWQGNAPAPDGWGDEELEEAGDRAEKQGKVFEFDLFNDDVHRMAEPIRSKAEFDEAVAQAEKTKSELHQQVMDGQSSDPPKPTIAMMAVCGCGRSWPLRYAPEECSCGLEIQATINELLRNRSNAPQDSVMVTRQEDFEKLLEEAKPENDWLLRATHQWVLDRADFVTSRTGRRPYLLIKEWGTDFLHVKLTKWVVIARRAEVEEKITETPEGMAEDRRNEDEVPPTPPQVTHTDGQDPPLPEQKWTHTQWLYALTEEEIAALPSGTRIRFNIAIPTLDNLMEKIGRVYNRRLTLSVYPDGARGNEDGPGILWIRRNLPMED